MTAAPDAERCLVDLLSLQREVLELAYVRRSDALERVTETTRRLGDSAPSERILVRAVAELGAVTPFHRVMISEVADGQMAPLAIWPSDAPGAAESVLAELQAAGPITLAYPLVEHEVTRRGGAQRVVVARAGARTPAALASALGWVQYVVAALVVGGETVGLVHGEGAEEELGLEVAERMAEELGGVLERAVLRHALERHREELRAATGWLGARLSHLEDAGAAGPLRALAGENGETMVRSLTPRELEVMRLLARGRTNRAIADALVVREGTVKYHVKNILRKLGATSRADAVARFVRAGGGG